MANRPRRIGVPGADKAYQNILKWLGRGEWEELFSGTVDEHVGDLYEALDIEPDGLADALGQDVFGMVVTCAVEDLLTRSDDAGANIVDDYLKRRGWRENAPGRRYLQALRDSVMSLYEVVEVVPGSHLVLRDMVREGAPPVRLDDRVGAEAAVLWDRIAARVVEVAGHRVLGAGMLPFPFDVAEAEAARIREACRQGEEALQKHFRDEGSELPPPREVIEEIVLGYWAPHLTRAWLAAEVLDREGFEPVVLHVVRLPMLEGDGVAAAVRARLDAAAPELVREDDPETGESSWNWSAPPAAAGEGGAGDVPGDGDEDDEEEEEAGSAGIVTLGEDAVVLLTNDADRAEQGRAMLAGLLEGLVGEATVDRVPLGGAGEEEEDGDLDEPGGEEAAAAAEAPEPDAPAGELSVEAATGKLAAVTDEVYRRMLGEPEPELGGVTPREAAASGDEERRAGLVTWLKRLENEDARSARATGLPAYDFRWMWAELGLADRRR